MKKNVVILPLDGYENSQLLLAALKKFLDSQGISELLAYVKLNDGVHDLSAGGPAIINSVREILATAGHQAGIFLDLKIFDVSATLENTLKKYSANPPDILTVSAQCSVAGIIKLRKLLPSTKLAMVSVPTDISEQECHWRQGTSPGIKIFSDLMNIRHIYQETEGFKDEEPFDFLVCSPKELTFLKNNLPLSYGFIVPGIRDSWMDNSREHQKRTTGVKAALDLGATFLVLGAQLTKGNPELEITPIVSQQLTLEEVAKAKNRISLFGGPLEVLKACGGYYCSQKDETDRWVGPAVAYAGTYQDGGASKNFIGLEYFNFAAAEGNSSVRAYFAKLIMAELSKAELSECDVLLGAPMGGIMLATDLGGQLSCRTIFAEKKILALADPASGAKEKSDQIIDRHEINFGDKVIIVEDVCNNFSTTQKLRDLIESKGGVLVGVVCAFNRSGLNEINGIPVLSAHFIPTKQFKQDDEEVKHLIVEEKIVWKPKVNWAKLQKLMNR